MRYGYNPFNRRTNEVTAGVMTNSYVFSGAGDLLKLLDGKNQATAWSYDAFGRVTNKVDAAGNVLFTYQYEANSRLTNR